MNLKFCLRDGNCRLWSSWMRKTCRVPNRVKEVEEYIKLETPDVVLKAVLPESIHTMAHAAIGIRTSLFYT